MAEQSTPALDLADLQNCRSPLLQKLVYSPETCTTTEKTLCHIFEELPIWNECLAVIHVELTECFPGRLHIGSGSIDFAEAVLPVAQEDQQRLRNEAITLLYWLLKEHRCVESFNSGSLRSPEFSRGQIRLLTSGLSSSPGLKSFTLRGDIFYFCCLVRNISSEATFLGGLEELCFHFLEENHETLAAISSFIATSSSLKKLSLLDFDLTAAEARVILDGLENNNTLTNLFLKFNCSPGSTEVHSEQLNEYLKSNAQLKTLTIRQTFLRPDAQPGLAFFINALRSNQTLLHVRLEGFYVDCDAERALERLVADNTMLQSFTLSDCVWFHSVGGEWERLHIFNKLDTVSLDFLSWMLMLKKRDFLEHLTIVSSFDVVCPGECVISFSVDKSFAQLGQVTVDDLKSYFSSCARQMCRDLSETAQNGALLDHENVGLVGHSPCVSPRALVEATKVTWDSGALSALRAINIITKLDLKFTLKYTTAAHQLAAYIENTRVLKSLRLELPPGTLHEQQDLSELYACRVCILDALSRNKSVTKLHVPFCTLSLDEAELLAQIIASSQRIHNVLFSQREEINSKFIHTLSQLLSQNFTLVSLEMETQLDWTKKSIRKRFVVVRNIVLRNNTLVTRAAHFVVGDWRRCCAEAIEIVASNPALVERVSEISYVSEQEAAKKVKGSLTSLQDMHSFMRAAGIVKQHVTCHPREDGRPQLDSLDKDSWLRIRTYLKVADVLQ